MMSAKIELPKQSYFPCEEVSGVVHFSFDKPVSQRRTTLSLIGSEKTEVSYQSGEHTMMAEEESEFLHEDSRLLLPTDEKGKLKAGDYDIPFRFLLPEGIPETYLGDNATIQYIIDVRIDVPLGFDITDSSEFEVVSSFQPFLSKTVDSFSGSWSDPKSAGIKLTLDRCEYGRGEVLTGKYEFKNPTSRNIRKIDVVLRWIEEAKAQDHEATAEVAEESAQIRVGGRLHKGEGAFSIQIPEGAPPTFESSLSSVTCTLSANLDIAFGSDVEAEAMIHVVGKKADADNMSSFTAGGWNRGAKEISGKTHQLERSDLLAAFVRCRECGTSIRTPGAAYCPNCGSRSQIRGRETTPRGRAASVRIDKRAYHTAVDLENCIVCSGQLGRNDDVVWCPHCGRLAHRVHLMEWIQSKNSCPVCGKSLKEDYYK